MELLRTKIQFSGESFGFVCVLVYFYYPFLLNIAKSTDMNTHNNPITRELLRGELGKGGVQALWRGTSATLWRDVIRARCLYARGFLVDQQHGRAHSKKFVYDAEQAAVKS